MNTVDEYLSNYPDEIQKRLCSIREVIIKNAPDVSERICMNMPTYDLNDKWFFHFAAFKNHIGIYPQPSGVRAFSEKLTEYKTSKGTIQFPHNKPLPLELIEDIVKYRYKEDEA